MVDYPNIFALGQDAFDQSYARTNKMRQDRANVGAGRALAQGDYAGAQQAFGEGGMPDQVMQTLQAGQQQQGRQAKIAAATAYGNGDATGAIQALGATGDIAGQSAIQQEAIQKHQAQMAFAQQEATKLRQVYAQAKAAQTPDGGIGALLQAYDAQAPQYRAMGTSDQEIAQLRQAIQQNPDGVLTAIAAPRRIDYKTVGDSLYAVDADTGQTIGDPIVGSKVMAVGPDQTVMRIGGQGNAGLTPAAGAGAGAGFDAVYSGFTAPHEGGYTASDGNGAPANFGINQKANPDLNVKDLQPDQAKQILHDRYWVPSGADSLPPALQAIQFDTAVNMGVGTAKAMLQASGGDPQKYLALRAQRYQQIAQNDPSKAASLPNWMQRNSDLAQFAARAGQPQQGPQQGGAQILAQGPQAQSAAMVNAGAAAGLQGDAFLQTLPPQMQQTVKAIAEGRMALPAGFVLKTPYGQQLIAAVGQYDPTFSAANAATRIATRKDFTSGRSAQTLTAFNTALAHLSNLDQAITNLNNNGLPLNNAAAHWIAGVTGTDSRIARFEYVKRTALDEVNKALVGAGGALGDREALMKQMNAASNPETLHAAVAEIADLLHGKINAMGQQYTQGMGTDAYPIQLITPQAQATLTRLQGGGSAAAGGSGSPAPSAGWGKMVVH